MSFQHFIRTRYSETGQDGIIHHSAYVVYLEEARIEFFRAIGCDINDLEKNQMYCPVVDLSIKYQKPLLSLEDIVVKVTADKVSAYRFSLSYKILRSDECVAAATSSHCFVGKDFKPISLPDKIAAQLKESVDKATSCA